MKRLFPFILLCIICFFGCNLFRPATVEEEPAPLEPLEADYDEIEKSLTHKEKLVEVRNDMLFGNGEKAAGAELAIDRKIAHAVWQLGRTLDPGYRRGRISKFIRGKRRLGFIEVLDINRDPPSKLHKYISEKVLTFSYLQPELTETMSIVEHFTMEDVKKLFHPHDIRTTALTEKRLVKKLGKLRKLDMIEVGTLTLSPRYLDLNLRIVETGSGRIIAVGSVKIESTNFTTQWLKDFSYGTPMAKPEDQTGELE